MIRVLNAAAIVVMILGNLSTFAQDSVPKTESAVTIQVDLAEFGKSKIGGLLIKAGSSLAAKELEQDPDQAIKSVHKSLGFDPIEQEIKLVVRVGNLHSPEEDVLAVAELKDTTGNLEGFLLAAPGYQSRKHNGHNVHHIDTGDQRVTVAFHTAPQGKKHVIASFSEDVVTRLLDQIDSGASSQHLGAKTLPAGRFIDVDLSQVPTELLSDTPMQHISELLRNASLMIGEADDALTAQLLLEASSDEKATQLQQLAQGVVAMTALFKEPIRKELDQEENAEEIMEILDGLSVERKGEKVSIEVSVPEPMVIRFLKEEADLPL